MINTLFGRFNSLRNRMAVTFLLLLTFITVVTLYVVNATTYQHSKKQVQQHALTSASVIRDKLNGRATLLHDSLKNMTANFSLKSLVYGVQGDPDSLQSAMHNFQLRNNADAYWVTDSVGRVLLSSMTDNSNLPIPEQITQAQIYWYLNQQQSYLIQAAPVKKTANSRKTDYWLVMGVAANSLINQELVDLTGMQISLIQPGRQNSLLASTYPVTEQVDLLTAPLSPLPQLQEIRLADKMHVYAAFDIGSWQQQIIYALVSISQDSAYVSYTSLLQLLAGLLGSAGVLAFITAVLFSTSVTKPIAKLANNALSISKGNFDVAFPAQSTSEVNTLSSAFKQMIASIKQREQKIHQLAYYDELTGLPNRVQFRQFIQQQIQQAADAQHIVFILDIDRFKDINDTVGHQTGDELLNMIAQRMRACDTKNALYARIGGDEFGIVYHNVPELHPEKKAQCIVDLFEAPFPIEGLTLSVEASVGMAVYPKDGDNADILMQRADIALYSCKNQPKSFAPYSAEFDKHSLQRLSLMSELKDALAQGQLQLYYQPKLSLLEGKIETAECLIRWFHPQHGFMPPDDFIPLAEQTGSIRQVTEWAIEQALQQHTQWRELGHCIAMAVNISAIDLIDMRLPGYVDNLLKKHAVDAHMLTLEVTESALMGDPETALGALNRLRQMGISLSIDDFGTGFSSMAQLKKMPVDELKIDKAFVLELATNMDDQIMVKTLISLANNLGLKTVAEGVEDEPSLAILKQNNCTKAQGFYLSKPLPANSFLDWLNQFDQQNMTQSA